jgi:hypothetical protein
MTLRVAFTRPTGRLGVRRTSAAFPFAPRRLQLASRQFWRKMWDMSAQEIIEQIKASPSDDRARVTKFVVESDDSWIPAEFKQGMADIAAGRVLDLDMGLNVRYPGAQ